MITQKKDFLQLQSGNNSSLFENQNIFVKKERQKWSDQLILNEWKEARIHFYSKQLQIQLQQTEKQYSIKQRQCVIFKKIAQLQLTSLKTIHIQYNQKMNQHGKMQCRYSISFFNLSHVIHKNKLVKEVTLKGVLVQYFQQFIMTDSSQKNPLLNIKLNIDANLRFYLKKVEQEVNMLLIKNLQTFIEHLQWLSNITAQIEFEQWSKLNDSANVLLNLWKCLKKVKKIKIKIAGQRDEDDFHLIMVQSVSSLRSLLFGELALFMEISQLQFIGIKFSQSININLFLAIQQSLFLLFSNNSVRHLRLQNCSNMPIFPKITTLESIYIQWASFRKDSILIAEVIRSNPSLKSIQCFYFSQIWRIDEALFNQLETLVIQRCDGCFIEIQSQLPSNLKHLRLLGSQHIDSVSFISTIVPKLENLTYLWLGYIHCGHQILCRIPSTQLEELHIEHNLTLTNEGLKKIDEKWPYLRNITLRKYCFFQIYLENLQFQRIIDLEGLQLQIIKRINKKPRNKFDQTVIITIKNQL